MSSNSPVLNRIMKGRWLLAAALILGLGYGVLNGVIDYRSGSPYVPLGDLTVNTRASIDRNTVYRLTLWETRLPVPGQLERVRDDLEGALTEFADRYPNVQVDVSFIPGDEMMSRLQEAVDAGQPPDVVALEEPVTEWDLQVPVTPYVPWEPGEDENPDQLLYYAAARDPWTAGHHLWGFPRWIAWEAWAGHDARLRTVGVDVDGAVRYGWTWDDLLQLARRLDTDRARERLAMDVQDPVLWMQMLANAGAPWWESAEGPLWSPRSLGETARLLRRLHEARAIPASAVRGAFDRVTHFVEREAVIIAPVNAPLYNALHRRIGADFILLPVPHHPEHEETSHLTPSAYAVFRQNPYKGDAHLRAAMELAYFLSRRFGLAVAQKAGFLPASPRDLHGWRDRAALHYLARNFLLDYLTHFARPGSKPPLVKYLPPPEVRQRLREALPSLWASPPPPPEQWAERTYDALKPFVTSTEGRSTNRGTDATPR